MLIEEKKKSNATFYYKVYSTLHLTRGRQKTFLPFKNSLRLVWVRCDTLAHRTFRLISLAVSKGISFHYDLVSNQQHSKREKERQTERIPTKTIENKDHKPNIKQKRFTLHCRMVVERAVSHPVSYRLARKLTIKSVVFLLMRKSLKCTQVEKCVASFEFISMLPNLKLSEMFSRNTRIYCVVSVFLPFLESITISMQIQSKMWSHLNVVIFNRMRSLWSGAEESECSFVISSLVVTFI